MDCISYIDDLSNEIKILRILKSNRIKEQLDYDDIDEKIIEKQNLLNDCKENLKKMSSNQIYYRIYLNLLNGMNTSKAIEKVAEENLKNGIKPCDVNTIWVNYYRKMKKILNNQVKTK